MYILISPLLKYAFIILWAYGKVVIMVISCMLDSPIVPHHLHPFLFARVPEASDVHHNCCQMVPSPTAVYHSSNLCPTPHPPFAYYNSKCSYT